MVNAPSPTPLTSTMEAQDILTGDVLKDALI